MVDRSIFSEIDKREVNAMKKEKRRRGMFGRPARSLRQLLRVFLTLGKNSKLHSASVVKMSDAIERLSKAVLARRFGDPATSKTAKLFLAGRSKMAQKLGEEAIEVAIDAARGDRPAVIVESADLIYQLVVLWAEMDIAPADVWDEMMRREQTQGIAEKLPKQAA
jgi:phosphoribosyl-ATP pyrophosphohydrolase